MKWIHPSYYLLVVAAVVLSGCSIARSTGTPSTPVVTTESRPAAESKPAAETKSASESKPAAQSTPAPAAPKEVKPSPEDLTGSRAAVEAYFTAVVNQDTALVNYLWDRAPESKGQKPTAKTGATARIEEALVNGAYDEGGTLTIYYTLAVDLGPNSPGGAWGPGVNRRWAQMVKRPDGWKVRTMATSPIQFE